MLIEDIGTLGMIARATRAAYLQSGDHELASRVGTLLGQRRSSLVALGLERIAREVPRLAEYVGAAADRVGGSNGAAPQLEVGPDA
jgi:hypothetical protein